MKKFVVFFISIILIFSLSERQVFSYEFGSFYSDIANNITEYDNLIFSVDLEGKDGIAKELNKRIGEKCFKDSLSTAKNAKTGQSDFDILVKNGSPAIMKKHLSDGCMGKDGSIGQTLLSKIQNAIWEFKNEIQQESENKTDTIQTLTQSSIYADGDMTNSPFDLMNDIEQIDEIIFERTQDIEYNPGKSTKLENKLLEKLDELLKGNNNKQLARKVKQQVTMCKLGGNCQVEDKINTLIADIQQQKENPKVLTGLISQQVCPIDTTNLKDSAKKIIANSIENKRAQKAPSIGTNGYSLGNKKNRDENEATEIKITSDYKKENDNSLFPCNDVLCIKADYRSYNHQLLGGWTRQYPSIEFLFKRANNHLKPLVAGSFAQSKMSIKNFELGLKDINLSEEFHMGLQITTKPVPILDLENNSQETLYSNLVREPAYGIKNQLYEHYKAEGLDYEQANDLSLLLSYKEDKLSTEHAKGLSPADAIADFQTYKQLQQKNYEKIETIKKEINTKVKNEGLNYLDDQFKEIEVMNTSIKDYITSLDHIVTQFSKTPRDTGQN